MKKLFIVLLLFKAGSVIAAATGIAHPPVADAVKQKFLNALPRLRDGWTFEPEDVYVMPLPAAYSNNPHTPVRQVLPADKIELGTTSLSLGADGRWSGIVNGRTVSLSIQIPADLPTEIGAQINMRVNERAEQPPHGILPSSDIDFTLRAKDCVLGVPGRPVATKLLDMANHYRAHSEMQVTKKFEGRLDAQTLWITKTDPQALRTSLLHAIYGIDRVRYRIGVFLNIGESDEVSGFVGVHNEMLRPVAAHKPLPDERYYDGARIYRTVTRTNGWDFPTDTWIPNWLSTIGLPVNEYATAWRWMNTIIRNTGVKVASIPLDRDPGYIEEARHIKIVPPLPAGTLPGYYYVTETRRRITSNDLISMEGPAQQLRYATVHKERWQPIRGVATTYEVFDYLPSSIERQFGDGVVFLPAEDLIAGRLPVGVYNPTGNIYTRISPGPRTVIEARYPVPAMSDNINSIVSLTDEAKTKQYFTDLSYISVASLTLSQLNQIRYEDFREFLIRLAPTLTKLIIKRDIQSTETITNFSFNQYKDFMFNVLPQLGNLTHLDIFLKYTPSIGWSVTETEAKQIARSIVGDMEDRVRWPGLPNLVSLKFTLPYVGSYTNGIPLVGLIGFGFDVARKATGWVYAEHLTLAGHLGAHARPELGEIKFYEHHGFGGKVDREKILEKLVGVRRAPGRFAAEIIKSDGTSIYGIISDTVTVNNTRGELA